MKRNTPCKTELYAIISKHFDSSMRDAQVVHHHCNTNAYVTLEDKTRIIIRICDGPYWTEKAEQIVKFKRERFAWETLKQIDGILTPRVIAVETDEAILPYPFLIMTYVPGTPMCEVFPTLSQGEQINLLEELGAVTSSIHDLIIDPEVLPNEICRWGSHCDELRNHLHELTVSGLMTTHARNRLERLLRTYSSRLAAMDKDIVFLHGDVHFPNILLQQNNGHWHISGLVDAELAGIGPRGRELRALEQFSFRGLNPEMRDAFLRGYGGGFGRDDYKLAYLTCELDPNWLNTELLKMIESTDFSESLDWINIFTE